MPGCTPDFLHLGKLVPLPMGAHCVSLSCTPVLVRLNTREKETGVDYAPSTNMLRVAEDNSAVSHYNVIHSC